MRNEIDALNFVEAIHGVQREEAALRNNDPHGSWKPAPMFFANSGGKRPLMWWPSEEAWERGVQSNMQKSREADKTMMAHAMKSQSQDSGHADAQRRKEVKHARIEKITKPFKEPAVNGDATKSKAQTRLER